MKSADENGYFFILLRTNPRFEETTPAKLHNSEKMDHSCNTTKTVPFKRTPGCLPNCADCGNQLTLADVVHHHQMLELRNRCRSLKLHLPSTSKRTAVTKQMDFEFASRIRFGLSAKEAKEHITAYLDQANDDKSMPKYTHSYLKACFQKTFCVPNCCAECGKTCHFEDVHLNSCGRCLLTLYCSKVCQSLDWQTHQSRCIPGMVQKVVTGTHTQDVMVVRSDTEKYKYITVIWHREDLLQN